jgi:K+-sensing histidine kinase KdpD
VRLRLVRGYFLAVASVSLALAGAVALEHYHFRDVEVPLFLFAVAISAWYGGAGPAVLSLLLSCVNVRESVASEYETVFMKRCT